MDSREAVSSFYHLHLQNIVDEKHRLRADCPFCEKKGLDPAGRIFVSLNPDSFFYGYFRCLNHCVPGGFLIWFARLAGLVLAEVPGYDQRRELMPRRFQYPLVNLNNDVQQFHGRLGTEMLEHFQKAGVEGQILGDLRVGYNGRYLVYPYVQDDGNCYAIRCVFPERKEDCFWQGNDEFFGDEQYFNLLEIQHCENGAIFVCQGEENLLIIKQLGFPGVAVPDLTSLEKLSPERFSFIHTVYIATENSPEADAAARSAAARLGYKARLLKWPIESERRCDLWQIASRKASGVRELVLSMMHAATAFSPFVSPVREYDTFVSQIKMEASDAYGDLRSGFPRFDRAMGGIHGMNVIGGAPKSGKSCLAIQLGTELARRRIPVLYYDFENGCQKIYQRTLCRMSRRPLVEIKRMFAAGDLDSEVSASCNELQQMLGYFRVVNDRKLNSDIMRRHIDFIRHESRSEYTVVIIDSLHKLPFKDFTEQRTGIDAWLRELESIRDEMGVSLLVLSELSRGRSDGYADTPHMGMFKGSGDIEYSADNALILAPEWDPLLSFTGQDRVTRLWLVASREQAPGLVARYALDYPYWGFAELEGDAV